MVTDINRKHKLRRQYVQMAVFCSVLGLLCAFLAAVWFSNPEIDFSDFHEIWEGIRNIRGNALFVCMFIGGVAVAFFDLYQYYGYLRERNSLRDEENGSAKWGNEEKNGIEKYNRDYLYSPRIAKSVEGAVKEKLSSIDANKKVLKGRVSKRAKEECFRQSQIIGEGIGLSLDTRFTRRNLNLFVLGGSGVGKSRNLVKPNMLQGNSSYVVTDPSGEIMQDCGGFLEKEGYVILCFNTENMARSMRYNPFAYVKSTSDIPKLVNALTTNIEGPKQGGGDSKFWDQTRLALLSACCAYLFESRPMEQRNFTNVMEMLRLFDTKKMVDVRPESAKVDKDGKEIRASEEDLRTQLDLLFEDWEAVFPTSYAVKQYKIFQMAGRGKTSENILISTAVTLGTYFDNEDVRNLTFQDELHLEQLGERKTALFIVTPQGDTTYGFLCSMLYNQLFDTLYRAGEERMIREHSTSPQLKEPVRVFIDEMANIGTIPMMSEKMATARKYGISIVCIFQNKAQIEKVYQKDAESIIGNCDSLLYLGGMETATVKMLSEKLGKATIKTHNRSLSYGKQSSGSESYQNTGRELLTPNEIEQIRNDKCLIFIRGCKPFLVNKYPYEKHPNYQFTAESNAEMDFSDRFLLSYDMERMEEIKVLSPMDERYRVPDTINEQAFALTMMAEQRKTYLERVKWMAREAAVGRSGGRDKGGEGCDFEKKGKDVAYGDGVAEVNGFEGFGGDDSLDEGQSQNPVKVLGHLGKTGEEIAEKQVVIGSWSPVYEYDIVTEFAFGEDMGKAEVSDEALPFG